ncbi:hypothetical protein PQX77_002831 [Marasmius sp. AFHP31]|nr:hypothetical protein PQX77_002831 [Marasmius sp. AFHP31]
MSVTSRSAVVSPHHSDVVNALIPEVETSSMALVGPLSAGPPAANVTFDFDTLSMPVTVTSDNVKIGPFTPSADLNVYLKSQFPDTATVEDVVRHGLLSNEKLVDHIEELELGIACRDKAIEQLLEMIKEYHGTIKLLESTVHASTDMKADILRQADGVRQSLKTVVGNVQTLQGVIKDQERHIGVLSTDLQAALAAIDQGHTVLREAWNAFLFIATRCLRHKNANVTEAAEYMFTVIQLMADAMGEAADELTDKQLAVPDALCLAYEWLDELKRFLGRATSTAREIIGAPDNVERIIQNFIPELQVRGLRERLIESNALPKVPAYPYLQPSFHGAAMIVVDDTSTLDSEDMDEDFRYPSSSSSIA